MSSAERKRRHRAALRKKKAKARFMARVAKKAARAQKHEQKLRRRLKMAQSKGTTRRGPPKGLPRPERWVTIPTARVHDKRAPGGSRLVVGEPELVFSAGAFANRIGRTPATIRFWIDTGVLPGPSIRLGGRAYFTDQYISAIIKASKRLYEESGVGSLDKLKALARQELREAGQSWIPKGGTEDDRVFPKKGDLPSEDLPLPVPEGR